MVVLVFRERVLGDKCISDRELLNHAGLSDVTDALLDDDLDTEPAAAATAAAETAPASTVAPAPTDANAVPSAASSGAADVEDAELAAALQKLPETILFLASTLLPGKVLTLESAGGALCVFFAQFSTEAYRCVRIQLHGASRWRPRRQQPSSSVHTVSCERCGRVTLVA